MKVMISFLIIVALPLLVFSDGIASIYRYTDDQGKSFYVDDLEMVPEQYRTRAVNMDQRLETMPVTVEPEKESDGGKEITQAIGYIEDKRHEIIRSIEKIDITMVNSTIVKYGVIVITMVLIFVMIFRTREYIGNKKAGFLMAGLAGFIMFIFLYSVYLKGTMDTYWTLKEKTEALRKQQGQKTGEQITDQEALMQLQEMRRNLLSGGADEEQEQRDSFQH